MPITSTTTQSGLSFPSQVELAGADVTYVDDGDWAYTADTKTTWRLDRTAMSGGVATSNNYGRWLPFNAATSVNTSFVFQPGGTAGGNVYTTEAALASATSSLDGVPYSIFMDFSYVGGTYVVTTVGAWALGPNGTWDDGGMGYAISFEHGTTLPHPPVTLSGALTWQTKQAIDVCSPAPAQHGYTAFRDATIAICYAAGALINSQSGSYALYFSDTAYAQRAGGTGFVFHASGGFLNVYANDFSYFGPGAVDTTLTGVAAINIGSPSAVIDVSLYPFIVVQGLFVDLFGGAVTTIPAVGDATGALLYSGRELYTSNGTSWGLALNVLPSSIYVVSPNGPYTSINAAITQAVADGHTDQTNAATVLIVPNPGGWNENVLLHGGVNLQGQWGGESYSVQINGKLSYTPGPVALSEKVNVSGVYVHALGEPCVEILGTNAGQLWVYNCQLSQYDALFPNVSMNGAHGSNLFFQDCDGNVHAGGTAYDIEAGSCYAVNTDLSSGHALRGVKVGATGYFEGRNSTHLVGRGPDAINIAAGGTVFLFGANVTQLQSGGSSAVLAGGTLTAVNTLFATPVAAGGYAAQGTGTFNYGGCSFEGSPNVQNTLTVTAIPSTPTLVP